MSLSFAGCCRSWATRSRSTSPRARQRLQRHKRRIFSKTWPEKLRYAQDSAHRNRTAFGGPRETGVFAECDICFSFFFSFQVLPPPQKKPYVCAISGELAVAELRFWCAKVQEKHHIEDSRCYNFDESCFRTLPLSEHGFKSSKVDAVALGDRQEKCDCVILDAYDTGWDVACPAVMGGQEEACMSDPGQRLHRRHRKHIGSHASHLLPSSSSRTAK